MFEISEEQCENWFIEGDCVKFGPFDLVVQGKKHRS